MPSSVDLYADVRALDGIRLEHYEPFGALADDATAMAESSSTGGTLPFTLHARILTYPPDLRSRRVCSLSLGLSGIRSQTVEVSGEVDSLVSDASQLNTEEPATLTVQGYLWIEEPKPVHGCLWIEEETPITRNSK